MAVRTTLLLAAAALAATAASGAELQLVRKGQPVAEIVLPADAAPSTQLAAEELNHYIQKMSGAKLDVVAQGDEKAPAVYLGSPDEKWVKSTDLGSLVFDGFVVESNGSRLVLAGNVPEGTLNAVYWLLEELGVRWYIPTELGETIPQKATISVPELRRREEPRFPCRRNHGIDTSIKPDGDIWRRRLRITSHALNVPFNRYSHNLYAVFPVAKYGETHPEYYPLISGKRRVPAPGLTHGWQPCTSNPEVVRLTIQAARDWFAKHPECNYFSVGMNDGRGWCECDNCTALDIPGETFRGRPVVSTRYFTFVKRVAEALKASHPDKFVSCIAYSSVEPLPQGVELPDNVMVVITQDVGQWHDDDYRREDQQFAKAWAQAAGAFGTYDYTGLGWMLPRCYPHLMAQSLRFYHDVAAVAVTNEAWPTWWYAGPMMYLRAKLTWDPTRDSDEVLDDYYSGFFGPAQAPMKRLYERFEACMMKERTGKWFEGLSSVPQQIALWTPDDLEACIAALGDARRLAADEPFAARVAFVARGFSWTEAILREYWQAEKLTQMAALGDTATGRLVDEVATLAQLTRRREALCEEICKEPLISGIYNRIVNTRGGRLASWYAFVDSALARGIGALHARGDEVDPERLGRIVAGASDRVAKQLHALAWVRANPQAPNLCVNPGFEATVATPAPEGIDWVTTDTPPGWSKWSIDSKPDRLTWEQEGGHSGERCARIAGARNATFIARLPVKPDEIYYASIWVRSTGSDRQQPKLSMKWQAPGGGWVRQDAGVMVDGDGGAGGWQLLSAVAQVPDEAGLLILLPGALEQQPGDHVTFDDARIVRLPDDLGVTPP